VNEGFELFRIGFQNAGYIEFLPQHRASISAEPLGWYGSAE
jgi:hypothetical protein